MTASKVGLLSSLGVLLTVVTAVFVAALDDYGPGYDEYIGNLVYGERTLHGLAGGRADLMALDEPTPLDFVVEGHRDLGADPTRLEGPHRQGQGAAMVSALVCQVFFRSLGWLPSIEAHHLSNLLFLLPVLVVLFVALTRLFGLGAAWLTMLLFFAQPRVVAHVFFNTKDTPEMCLFIGAMLAFWWGWTKERRGLLFCAAVLAGFAASVKINGTLIPVVLMLWIVLVPRLVPGPRLGLIGWLGWGLTGLLTFFVTWPYLLWEPDGIVRHVQFILEQGHTGSFRFSLMPLREWLVATPEIVQLGLAIGLVTMSRERDAARRAFLLLMALGFGVPMVRANLPGFRHYDGIRHILEITMPAAALSAYGWTRCLAWLEARWPRRLVVAPGALLIVLAVLPWVRGLHPYELAYFNAASGGLSGAVGRGHRDAGDYWATSYRRGTAWLNENAETGATLVVPWAQHLVTLSRGSEIGLRDDIILLDLWDPFRFDEADSLLHYERALARGPVYVMFITREYAANAISRHAARYGTQVYPDGEWDGVQVLNIMRVEGLP